MIGITDRMNSSQFKPQVGVSTMSEKSLVVDPNQYVLIDVLYLQHKVHRLKQKKSALKMKEMQLREWETRLRIQEANLATVPEPASSRTTKRVTFGENTVYSMEDTVQEAEEGDICL
jgi:hypothetical protein